MVTFTSDQIDHFSHHIKECLINKDCRNELKLYLTKYGRTPLLKVLNVYDKMCEITSGTSTWNDEEISKLMAVSGLIFSDSPENKPENIKEHCCDKLQVVLDSFIKHLREHNAEPAD